MKSLSRIIKSSPGQGSVKSWEPVNFNIFDLKVASAEEEAARAQEGRVLLAEKEIAEADKGEVFQEYAEQEETPVQAEEISCKVISQGPQKYAKVLMWLPDEILPGVSLEKPVTEKVDEKKEEVNLEKEKELNAAILEERNKLEEEIENSRQQLQTIQKEAEDTLQRANSQAAEIVASAEGQANQIQQRAYDEGVQQGRAEALKLIEDAQNVIVGTKNWRDEIFHQSEPAIIALIQSVAQKLFGNGFRLDPPSVEQMVARAISEANRLGNLRVYMNPEDKMALDTLWQDSELMINGQKIELIANQNIKPGGCFVEGEFGAVDSRIDSQLGVVVEELSNVQNLREKERAHSHMEEPEEKTDLVEGADAVEVVEAVSQVEVNNEPVEENLEGENS